METHVNETAHPCANAVRAAEAVFADQGVETAVVVTDTEVSADGVFLKEARQTASVVPTSIVKLQDCETRLDPVNFNVAPWLAVPRADETERVGALFDLAQVCPMLFFAALLSPAVVDAGRVVPFRTELDVLSVGRAGRCKGQSLLQRRAITLVQRCV